MAMSKITQLQADGYAIRMMKVAGDDFISLTDIARQKNPDFPADVVRNWMRSKATVAFLGLWEQLHNPDFKLVEFDQFKNEAGSNAFVLPPQVWIEKTNAIGMFSRSGRYGGGTFAHHDMINDGIPQPQRLKRLNEIAIHQMRVLSEVDNRNLLK
jgi:hypothetical protein